MWTCRQAAACKHLLGSGLPHRSPSTSALTTTLACRFDFVRGYGGRYVQHYVQNTMPSFAVAEFWDTLDYEGSIPKVNQDRHRQQMIDWINDGKGTALCFDFTLKGILHAAFEVGSTPSGLLGAVCRSLERRISTCGGIRSTSATSSLQP